MYLLQYLLNCLLLLQSISDCVVNSMPSANTETEAATTVNSIKNGIQPTLELPQPILSMRKQKNIINFTDDEHNSDDDDDDDDAITDEDVRRGRSYRTTLMDVVLQASAKEGLDAMTELYHKIEPDIVRNGQLLADNHPAALLSKFSAPVEDTEGREMAAYAAITATKAFKKNYKHINVLARQAHTPKISLRRTALEGLCPPRDSPTCMPASERYRTHDGTCNNKRRLRWGAAQMPFNRFLPPEYGDGVDTIRNSIEGGALSSSRFVSLLVHGARDGEAPLTLMTAQWGQLLDHDMTSTAQPRSINGSVPSCCGGKDFHPSCFPIKVPLDDPWLAPLKVRCLEFLRSAPAQRRDCVLSWREQTNQATSYIDASPIYSSSAKTSDNARLFRNGLLIFGRGNNADDVCQRGAIARQCIRAGDGRSGEQPGLLALHHVWVGEHNLIAMELSEMNPHWSDEKVYQETRRIIGAMFQHITYREFLPIILGREVCKLFDLELLTSGYYEGYDPKTNPTVANSFAAAAFRFGHSLVQNSYLRCDRHHNVLSNNVSLHEEFQLGDIGSAGSLHRLLRGMANQRVLKRDEFITPELTNHLFQTPGFPFGLDLAAINIQRGRDHGIAPYTAWRVPCGLSPINDWDDFNNVVGEESARRISHAYRSVHDIDLFVGGISERPVVGGLVGPTFACIIAQQFSNSRKGDRFWYENAGFESTFTPAQLHSIRRVSLAQVLCRAVGGGTFQPHIFLPHDFPENERVPCGTGPLTPIDLGPWLEQDPFRAPLPTPTFETPVPERIFEIVQADLNTNTIHVLKEDKTNIRVRPVISINHTPHVDFIPNSSSGFQRPTLTSANDKINDKLDFKRKGSSTTKRPTKRPVKGVNNKLDKGGTRVTLHIKNVNRRRPQIATTTRRTVIVNNVPIELRSTEAKNTTETEPNVDSQKKRTNHHTRTKSKKKKGNSVSKIEALKARADNLSSTNSKEKQVDNSTRANDGKIPEEDIFDVFSTLTEPPTEILQTTEHEPDKLEPRTVDEEFSSSEVVTDNVVELKERNDHPIVDHKEHSNSADQVLLKTKQNGNTAMTENLDAESLTDHKLTEHNNNETSGTDTIYESKRPNMPYDNFKEIKLQKTDTEIRATNKTTSSKTSNQVTDRIDFQMQELLKLQDSDIDPMHHSTSTEHKRVQRDFDIKGISHLSRSPSLGFAQRYKLSNTSAENGNPTILATTRGYKIKQFTSKLPKITKRASTDSAELRQYNREHAYTRPQKVVVDGPNSDQYEIEINIRQTNKSPIAKPDHNYADYTTAYRPYGYDRYTNVANSDYIDYTSTTPMHSYYQTRPSTSVTFAQIQRTKPPTVIYINEHDDHTTTRQPGLLQNFISFATSGFAGIRNPLSQSNAQKGEDRPPYSYNRYPSDGGLTSSVVSRPHSSISSEQYSPEQQQLQSPLLSSSFSQVSSFPGNNGAHVASSAVSSGHFGSIIGVANANGADSTFSFNIRPRPGSAALTAPMQPISGSYGLLPPRRPTVSQSVTPQYVGSPVSDISNQYYTETTNREALNSPFSISYNKPVQHNTYEYLSRTELDLKKKDVPNPPAHKLDINDYDYLSRTLETNNTSIELSGNESDEKDDYLYNDEDDEDDDDGDENEKPSAKFDRDGYLRPEHMLESLLKSQDAVTINLTDTNATSTFDDNFVLPVLNDTTPMHTNVPIPIQIATEPSFELTNTNTETTTNYPDAEEKNLKNDLLAEEEYDEDTTFIAPRAVLRSKNKLSQSIAFAPINILTKPERPDNWVIYERPIEKPLLPELPPFNVDTFAVAEVPMPIGSLNNAWFTKYRDKIMDKANGIMEGKQSFKDKINEPVKKINSTEENERLGNTKSTDVKQKTDGVETADRKDGLDVTEITSTSTTGTINTDRPEREDSIDKAQTEDNADDKKTTQEFEETNRTRSLSTMKSTDVQLSLDVNESVESTKVMDTTLISDPTVTENTKVSEDSTANADLIKNIETSTFKIRNGIQKTEITNDTENTKIIGKIETKITENPGHTETLDHTDQLDNRDRTANGTYDETRASAVTTEKIEFSNIRNNWMNIDKTKTTGADKKESFGNKAEDTEDTDSTKIEYPIYTLNTNNVQNTQISDVIERTESTNDMELKNNKEITRKSHEQVTEKTDIIQRTDFIKDNKLSNKTENKLINSSDFIETLNLTEDFMTKNITEKGHLKESIDNTAKVKSTKNKVQNDTFKTSNEESLQLRNSTKSIDSTEITEETESELITGISHDADTRKTNDNVTNKTDGIKSDTTVQKTNKNITATSLITAIPNMTTDRRSRPHDLEEFDNLISTKNSTITENTNKIPQVNTNSIGKGDNTVE